MISLARVSKSYNFGDGNTIDVLSDINLEITKGEFIGILGASGSGKSTLMYIMGLLDIPTSGSLYLNAKDTKTFSDQELSIARNKFIGFVFQQFNLIENLSAFDNVVLPALYSKEPMDFDPKERGARLLEKFGLLPRALFHPNRLSGGEQQRVAIARALMMNPKIILADEPTGNLDSRNGEEIFRILADLNRSEKVSVVVVTHNKSFAKKTNRQIFLKDGRIVKHL
ncbi:MAG: ABC transporter ATP-binding protein [Patescibacteria group bacterium]